MNKSDLKIAFFGGEPLGLPALEVLVQSKLCPELVICNPDRPVGRGQALTPPRIKTWAEQKGLPVFQPTSFKDKEALSFLTDTSWDLFVVVAYNHILPQWLISLPTYGTINVHPSLLPKLRGPSPIRTAILEDKPTELGVSIMLLDEKMDAGPLLSQTPLVLNDWPISGLLLDDMLAHIGAEMLVAVIPKWIKGDITPTPQDHTAATYTKKFDKAMSELIIDPLQLPTGETALETLCKIYAFQGIGDTFFMDAGKRIKIKHATLTNESTPRLEIKTVVPEGKKEIPFSTYLASR